MNELIVFLVEKNLALAHEAAFTIAKTIDFVPLHRLEQLAVDALTTAAIRSQEIEGDFSEFTVWNIYRAIMEEPEIRDVLKLRRSIHTARASLRFEHNSEPSIADIAQFLGRTIREIEAAEKIA